MARPKAAVLIALSPLVGYWFGLWETGSPIRNSADLPALLLSWWCIHAGSVLLNACLDRDTVAPLWGTAGPVPPGTAQVANALLVAGVGVGSVAGVDVGVVCALAALLAVLYSHPSTQWKGGRIRGPFVNVVGYGVLSPLAGWLLVDTHPTLLTLSGAALLAVTSASIYFYAQVFQESADRLQNYETLVARRGPHRVCQTVRVLGAVSAVGVAALCVSQAFPRILLLALPLWLIPDRVVHRSGPSATEHDVRRYVLSVLFLGSALLGLACVDFFSSGLAPSELVRLPLGMPGELQLVLDRVFASLCHQMPARCRITADTLGPICHRCYGFYSGLAIFCGGALLIRARRRSRGVLIVCVVAAAMLGGDVFVLDSNISSRLTTGLLLGVATGACSMGVPRRESLFPCIAVWVVGLALVAVPFQTGSAFAYTIVALIGVGTAVGVLLSTGWAIATCPKRAERTQAGHL